MSKRALLWVLAIAALGLAYWVAAGADVDIGSRSDCAGLLSLPHWFDEACKDARIVRLMALLVGAGAAAILVYVAERDVEPRSRLLSWLRAVAQVSGPDEVVLVYHEVERSSDTAHYHCTDCGFETAEEEEAETHRWQEVESETAPSGR